MDKMIEDAKKTASVIGYNYPDSKWYRYSYELVGSDNDDKINYLHEQLYRWIVFPWERVKGGM